MKCGISGSLPGSVVRDPDPGSRQVLTAPEPAILGPLDGTNGISRTNRRRNSERNHHGSEPNLIPIVQPPRSGHPFFSNVRAVLASEIFEHRLLPFEHQPRVVSRDARRVDPHGSIRCSSENVCALGNGNLARRPDQPVSRRHISRLRRGPVSQLADEPVAKPVNRPHEFRRIRRIAERASNFFDEAREIGIENVG